MKAWNVLVDVFDDWLQDAESAMNAWMMCAILFLVPIMGIAAYFDWSGLRFALIAAAIFIGSAFYVRSRYLIVQERFQEMRERVQMRDPM